MESSKPTVPFGDLAPWAEPAWSHGIASPYYNGSHRKLRNALREYIDTHILPHSLDWEAKGEAPLPERLRWVKSGFPFTDVPSKYRPPTIPNPASNSLSDLDAFHLLVSTDETSRIEGGVTSCLGGASIIGAPPLIHHGTESQKQTYLPGLFDFTTSFCLGVTEPSGGSDVANIRTTASPSQDGSHYLVTGSKKWITGAPWATHMTTAVRTSGPGAAGLSVLLIPLSSPGVTVTRLSNSGQNAGGASLVDLDNVSVPIANRIGPEGAGFKIIMANFNRERFIMAAGCNRKSRTCLSTALSYASTRETFGKPLLSNQIISSKFATLARQVETHYSFLESIAYAVDESRKTGKGGWEDADIAGRIALAKVQGGRMLEEACREAQQVLGARGYQRGNVVEQISRDLRMMVVGGGSEEIIADLAVRREVGAARGRGWKL